MDRYHLTRMATALCAAALLVAAVPDTAFGAVLASETYGSDFKITGAGHSVEATGGQYVITGTGGNTVSTYELPGPGASAPFTVSTKVGSAPGSPGSFNVGLKVGNNDVVFHPGYVPIPGALRVEGTGGFGNQSVGFVPALNVLHTLIVTGDGAGKFTLTLKDGTGSSPDYTKSWTNTGNAVDTIGVQRSGGTNLNAMFDDLSVPPAPVETFSSDLSAGVVGRIEVDADGRLEMQGAGTNTLTYPGHAGNLLISGKVGASPGSSSTNVGIRVGGNNMVFHPNYSVTPGAFRVEGSGGFGNQDMGFTPAGGSLHTMDVAVDAATGRFTVAVTDANNPNNTYAARFTNGTYAPGTDQVGFKHGSSGADEGRFDDFQVAELLQSTDGMPSWVNAIQADNPLHWYRLDETGSKIAIDSGSAAQHGVYQNGVTQGVVGPTNGAAQFDGINDKVSLGAGDLSGDWTAEFVVKKLGQEPAGSLLRGAVGALRLDQWNNTGEVGFTRFGVLDYRFDPNPPGDPRYSAPIDQFVHLAFVGVSGTDISLYADGTLVGTSSNYIPLPLSEIGSADPGNMVLDEVVVFNRALGASEIRAHADALTAAVIPEPMTMLAVGLSVAGLGGYVRRRRSA